MKKIFFFGGDYDRSGGTERVSTIIANELALRGYEVALVSAQCGEKPFFSLNPNIKRYSLFKKKGRFVFRWPVLIAKLRLLLISEKPDVLIGVESMTALFTIPASIGLVAKVVCWEHFHFHNDNGHIGRALARRIAARFCDDIVTLTRRDLGFWKKSISIRAKIQSIYNPSPFPPQVIDSSFKREKIVLAVGRLTNVKGFDRLLSAWQEVSTHGLGWRLMIVGDGEDKVFLRGLCDEFCIGDSVEFIPTTLDIAGYYKRASIYCLSSRFEGFPMVLLEASAFAIPIVSFDCDNGPDELLAGTGAALVRQGDINDLAKNLLRFINDPILRQEVGLAEMVRIEQFQPQQIVDRWVELVER